MRPCRLRPGSKGERRPRPDKALTAHFDESHFDEWRLLCCALQGIHDPTAPSLAVALVNGKVQLTRGVRDDNPVLIDTGMKLTQVRAAVQHAPPSSAPSALLHSTLKLL